MSCIRTRCVIKKTLRNHKKANICDLSPTEIIKSVNRIYSLTVYDFPGDPCWRLFWCWSRVNNGMTNQSIDQFGCGDQISQSQIIFPLILIDD